MSASRRQIGGEGFHALHRMVRMPQLGRGVKPGCFKLDDDLVIQLFHRAADDAKYLTVAACSPLCS